MTADGNNNAPVIDDNDDLNTTAPHSHPVAWQMPEPVFRQTSGKLPGGFEKNYGIAATASADGILETEPIPAAAPVANEADFYVEPKPKSSFLKLILVLLGLTAMIAFIVVFLTVVYFLFLRWD